LRQLEAEKKALEDEKKLKKLIEKNGASIGKPNI